MSQQRPLQPVAEEGRGENEVVQSVNLAANVATNAAANTMGNAPRNAQNNVANTTRAQQQNAAANVGQNAGAQPPPVQANCPQSSQRQRIRDEAEIARRANYGRGNGVPDPLDANHPI
jgi:hypothetical protein